MKYDKNVIVIDLDGNSEIYENVHGGVTAIGYAIEFKNGDVVYIHPATKDRIVIETEEVG